MPYLQIFTCGGCGKEKGKVNHWWIGQAKAGYFWVSEWNINLAKEKDSESFCGQECLTKAISEWMSKTNPNVVPK